MIYVFYNNDPLAQDQGGGAEHFRALHRALLKSGLPFRLIASRLQRRRRAPHVEYIAEGASFPRYYLALWRWFWRNRHRFAPEDVFHFHRNYAAWPKFLLCRGRGRVLISYHNVTGRVLRGRLGPFAVPIRRLMLAFERRAVRRADALVCVSGRDRGELERLVANEPFARAEVIPAAFDATLFAARPQGPPAPELARRLLFLGRLSHQKNVGLAIATLEHLRQADEPWSLTIVGDGEEARQLIRRIARSPAAAAIRWLGRVPHDRVVELFATHGILLLTSRYEASPTVVKEALAAVRPVVSTDVGDVRDWIEEGVTGFVTEPDPRALAAAVRRASRLIEEGRCRRSTRLDSLAERQIMERVLLLYRELQAG